MEPRCHLPLKKRRIVYEPDAIEGHCFSDACYSSLGPRCHVPPTETIVYEPDAIEGHSFPETTHSSVEPRCALLPTQTIVYEPDAIEADYFSEASFSSIEPRRHLSPTESIVYEPDAIEGHRFSEASSVEPTCHQDEPIDYSSTKPTSSHPYKQRIVYEPLKNRFVHKEDLIDLTSQVY